MKIDSEFQVLSFECSAGSDMPFTEHLKLKTENVSAVD